jgi:predicted enzyme related to lactoylglutathione lyase
MTTDRIDGVVGILVWTSAEQFDAMAAFYAEVLELPVRTRRDGFVSFAWPGRSDVRLTVSVHDGVAGSTREPDRLMVNLGVRDIDAVARRLDAAGIRFSRAPTAEGWGGWIATFHDPDGNTLQLLQSA